MLQNKTTKHSLIGKPKKQGNIIINADQKHSLNVTTITLQFQNMWRVIRKITQSKTKTEKTINGNYKE